MAGRTPPEAVAAFVEPLQQAISCVSPAVLQVAGGYRPAAHPHALVLADGEPQPLRAEAELALLVAQQYRIVEDTESRGPWKVQNRRVLLVTSGDCICRPDALPSRMCFASSLRSLVFSRCGRTGPTCSMPPGLAMSAGAPGPPRQASGDD